MACPNEIAVDGVKFIREDTLPSPRPSGNRAVVVVDRGWIFAGDVTERGDKLVLDRAVWVFKWAEVGFDGVIANPKSGKVVTRKMATQVEIPAGSEIFRCPVASDWGL